MSQVWLNIKAAIRGNETSEAWKSLSGIKLDPHKFIVFGSLFKKEKESGYGYDVINNMILSVLICIYYIYGSI